MNESITITRQVHFNGGGRGNRRRLEEGPPPEIVTREPGPRATRRPPAGPGLAHRRTVRRGEMASYAEVAVLGHVTRARVSQIMNLLNLAPAIMEAILFLPRTVRGPRPAHHPRVTADCLDSGLAQAAGPVAATNQETCPAAERSGRTGPCPRTRGEQRCTSPRHHRLIPRLPSASNAGSVAISAFM